MNHLHPVEHDGHPQRQAGQGAHHDDRELLDTVLNMPVQKNRIVTRAPAEPFRLTFIDVTCLVINRTIGTWDPRATLN
jgi:hypothetical protein